MRILITGAAGFIGSRLAEALIGHGHVVVGIDNLSTGRKENFPSGADLVIGDIRDRKQLPDGDWDVVYHAAASYKDRDDWEGDSSTNVGGTINVIRHAKNTSAKLIYFQTALCYGPNPKSPVTIDTPLAPQGSYAVSKTAGENYIRDSGLEWVSLRLANMYGPRNLSGPVPTFYKRLSEFKPCTVVDSRRDFMFIDDLIWVAVNASKEGQGVFHISSGTDIPIIDVYRAVGAAMGGSFPEAEIVPRNPDDVATLLLDPTETEQTFRWKAMTPLTVGIERAVRWYEQHPVTETYTHLKENKQ